MTWLITDFLILAFGISALLAISLLPPKAGSALLYLSGVILLIAATVALSLG